MTEPMSPPAAPRLASVDAYRGFVMLLMMAEVMDFSGVARAVPESGFWRFLGWNQSHAEWVGCSLHDLIQPSFSFLVGVALPFSLASRAQQGQSAAGMTVRTLRRALVLILLGVFLRSIGRTQTEWTFEDTLTQIGLGYPLLFLCGFLPARRQWLAFGFVVVGYWAAWALYPLPGPGFDYAAVNVPAGWTHHADGFAAHWNMNANLGAAFDRWFMNLFPRATPYAGNHGGYLTLSFIPTLGTMLLGLVAGGWLRQPLPDRERLRRMLLAGAACAAAGLLLHGLGLCPIVKRIWTPAWTLFSGGLCFFLLAAFYAVIDVRGWCRWAFPLIVIGCNSITAYCLAHLLERFVAESLQIHFGAGLFAAFGVAYVPLCRGALVLGVFWLILFWMYRRRLFLKV